VDFKDVKDNVEELLKGCLVLRIFRNLVILSEHDL